MKRLTALQSQVMDFCKKEIDKAREINVDIKKVKKKDYARAKEVLDAQNGIVFAPGGNCTIKTLRILESYGLIEVIEDNFGIGTGCGAFPSKVKILNY